MTVDAQLLRQYHSWSPDVILFSVAELDPELRSSLGLVDGEFALSLIGTSQGSQILNREAASLLQLFCNSTRTIDAVEVLARAERQPVDQILPGAIALIAQWRQNGVLIASDIPPGERPAPPTPKPANLGRYRVHRLMRSGISTELYLVEDIQHGLKVLKISIHGHERLVARQLNREALALQRLNGFCAPALLEQGSIDDRPFLCMEWLPGNEVEVEASRLRMGARDARSELLELTRSVVRAYAVIHRAGVIHGDVHPGNVLALPSGEIRIVDFGLSCLVNERDELPPVRGGFPFFFEPEYAQALLQKAPPPPPTPKGEEFALATLLYFLLTGKHYLDFSADRETALRQIVTDPIRPFSKLGLVPWPEMEAVLSNALAKDPSARYPSMDCFEAAIGEIPDPGGVGGSAPVRDESLAALLDPRRIPLDPPSASIGYGAAGIAYVFRRAACVLERPDLLGAAELWLDRAWKEASRPTGFISSADEIGDGIADPASLYYGVAGIHIVGALVGQTMGDFRPVRRAIAHFASMRAEAIPLADATSGSASALLGCALLAELHPPADICDTGTLIEAGQRLCEDLSQKLISSSPISDQNGLEFLGAAHGRAGALHAVLRWHSSAGIPLPSSISDKLHELASLGVAQGNSTGWPISIRDRRRLGGWCHGAAGYVSLWATAYQVSRHDAFMTLAVRSAEHVWKSPEKSIGQLCCGLAGQAESLLTAYRLTGDRSWVDRARQFASCIDRAALIPHSLLKGRLGAALLDLDLAAPDTSGMPLFDREWL
jgi:serine/threonine-protein kinase